MHLLKNYRDFVLSVIEKDYKNPLSEIKNSVIWGTDEFVTEIKDTFLYGKKHDRDLPALKGFSSRPQLNQIEKVVDSILRSERMLARQVKLHLCHRHSGMKLKGV